MLIRIPFISQVFIKHPDIRQLDYTVASTTQGIGQLGYTVAFRLHAPSCRLARGSHTPLDGGPPRVAVAGSLVIVSTPSRALHSQYRTAADGFQLGVDEVAVAGSVVRVRNVTDRFQLGVAEAGAASIISRFFNRALSKGKRCRNDRSWESGPWLPHPPQATRWWGRPSGLIARILSRISIKTQSTTDRDGTIQYTSAVLAART